MRKEPLAQLTAAEAASVVGASGQCLTAGTCETLIHGSCNLFSQTVC